MQHTSIYVPAFNKTYMKVCYDDPHVDNLIHVSMMLRYSKTTYFAHYATFRIASSTRVNLLERESICVSTVNGHLFEGTTYISESELAAMNPLNLTAELSCEFCEQGKDGIAPDDLVIVVDETHETTLARKYLR